MTEDRKMQIAASFDGEPTPGPVGPLDADDLAYLRSLANLRALARSHDPAAGLPARRPTLPARRDPRPIVAALALAATVVAALLIRRDDPPVGPAPAFVASHPAGDRPRVASTRSGEVDLYRWANDRPMRPVAAARAIVARSIPEHARRSSSREVHAIELANADPAAARLPRPVASRSSGSSRRPAHPQRPRPSHPRA